MAVISIYIKARQQKMDSKIERISKIIIFNNKRCICSKWWTSYKCAWICIKKWFLLNNALEIAHDHKGAKKIQVIVDKIGVGSVNACSVKERVIGGVQIESKEEDWCGLWYW